jgi:hypothetical protein
MGKSKEKLTEKRADKASTGESKHKTMSTDGGSKHKHNKKPSFVTLGIIPLATTIPDTDAALPNDWAAICWIERFRGLHEFKAQFGHCLVPLKYSANPKLGHWVATQRHNYRLYHEGSPGFMTAEHIRELESVGFIWDISAAVWKDRFEQLREFKAKFGHSRVPREYSPNPELGKWVNQLRLNFKLYQKGKPSFMTEERIRALFVAAILATIQANRRSHDGVEGCLPIDHRNPSTR